MGREEIEFLVKNNVSFYENYMPPAWKDKMVSELGPQASRVELNDNLLVLLVEAISEEIPWFAEVVSRERRAWLINELELALRDIKASQPS